MDQEILSRHCERSEAIQGGSHCALDCRVATLLAMTISKWDGSDFHSAAYQAVI